MRNAPETPRTQIPFIDKRLSRISSDQRPNSSSFFYLYKGKARDLKGKRGRVNREKRKKTVETPKREEEGESKGRKKKNKDRRALRTTRQQPDTCRREKRRQ